MKIHNMPVIFLINEIMHAFTVDKFNTSGLQFTYVSLGYLFKSIVDATCTLPEICPVP